jgi:hypothetical protein
MELEHSNQQKKDCSSLKCIEIGELLQQITMENNN